MEKIVQLTKRGELLVLNPFLELGPLDWGLNSLLNTILRRVPLCTFLTKHGQCIGTLLLKLGSNGKTTGIILLRLSHWRLLDSWKTLTKLLMNLFSCYMSALTILQVWILNLSNGNRFWKLWRGRTISSVLIVLTKALLVEISTRMPMLWDCSKRNMTESCCSNPMPRTLVSMVREQVLCQSSQVASKNTTSSCPESNNLLVCYTLTLPSMVLVLLTSSFLTKLWLKNGMLNSKSCQAELLKWGIHSNRNSKLKVILTTGNILSTKLVCLLSLGWTLRWLMNWEKIMLSIWQLMAEFH